MTTELAPLDLPEDPDPPELREYKKKVLEVARKHKQIEGWCDSGFARALAELGVDETQSRVTVRVRISPGMFFDTEIEVNDYRGLTAEQQAEALLESTKDRLRKAGISLEVTARDVASMEVIATAAGKNTPGWEWIAHHPRRVRHAYSALEYGGAWSACGTNRISRTQHHDRSIVSQRGDCLRCTAALEV